jgi:hypothetical protein
MVEEVYDQAFDVRAVVVLICHYHNATIAECSDVIVLLSNLKTHNLSKIRNLFIFKNLLHICFSNV